MKEKDFAVRITTYINDKLYNVVSLLNATKQDAVQCLAQNKETAKNNGVQFIESDQQHFVGTKEDFPFGTWKYVNEIVVNF